MQLLGARRTLLRRRSVAAVTFVQGIYFRATNNQSSPTNYDAETANTLNYPRTSAQGNTVGWEVATAGINTADRDVTTDVRLKGIAFCTNANGMQYRINLPAAGTYKIRAAMGDSGFKHQQRIRVYDTASLLADFDSGSGTVNVPADQWMDATGVIRTTEANWVNNNALLTVTFTTTIARFLFGQSVGTADTNCTVNTLFIST